MTDERVAERTRAILEQAVAGLDPEDLAERIAYCQENNEHGVRMHLDPDDELIEFRWGGRRLAMAHRDVLTGDGPAVREFIAEDPVPDTVPGDWTGDTR